MPMGMPERIKERRVSLGMTQEELANKLGLQKSAIAKYEKGRVENIKRSVILKMSEILECSPPYLMGFVDDVQENKDLRPVSVRRFHVLSSIACGEPILMQEEREVYIDASVDINADYILIAKGDSMTGARINDGDIVFIRSQPTVENGEIAAVAIDDEATLKRFYRYGDIVVLRAENPAYPEMQFTKKDGKELRILGKAVMFQSEVK